MKKIIVEGLVCVGPNFSSGDFALIKQNLKKMLKRLNLSVYSHLK